MRLAEDAAGEGFRLRYLPEVGSTNDEAAAAARQGDPGRLWVVAGRQLSGRGRHGRVWSSPDGNLYASLFLVEPCAMAQAAQFGYLIGLALHEAVSTVAPEAVDGFKLKWPNDLLHEGAKVAGVLLEGHRDARGRFAMIVGIGVNVAAAPTDVPYPATALAAVAPGVTREALFLALSAALARRYRAFQAADGDPGRFAELRAQWLRHAAGIGGEVTIRLPGGPRTGRFVGLDDGGRLCLRTATGVETIDAGDLFFPGGPVRAD